MWEFLRGIEMKNRFLAILSAFLILMAGSGIGAAAEIMVHPGESIQAAVDNATTGDTIIVEPGTYNEDITIYKSYVTVKSKSGNPDDTIIYGSASASDYYDLAINNAVFEGFTFNGNYSGWCTVVSNFVCVTAKNCKIINYEGGMLAATDAAIIAENTQFIKCGTGMSGAPLTYVGAENCKFINCGTALVPGGGLDGHYSFKNNVEIHTDKSGKQVVTPIPDRYYDGTYPEEPEPAPTEPPVDNTKPTEPVPTPTEPGQPTAPSNNTTAPAEPAPTEPPVETPIEETGGSSGNSHHSSGSSGGSHHSSSGGSGGTGGSPEDQKNVASKDTTKVFVPNEKQVTFNFTNNVTVVESISFTSKKTMGKLTAITEDLKNKSSLVKDLPEGEIYKSFNVWVGNAGYGDSDNILNATMDFKVNQTWIKENNIDPDSIILYKYNEKDKKWIEIPVTFVGKDDQYVYYMANVPGYSSFVITGKAANIQLASEPVNEPVNEPITSTVKSVVNSTATKTPKESPGFGVITGIVCLICVIISKK